MTRKEQIAVLTAHKVGIEAANTYMEFKIQQIAYIEFLIEEFKAENTKENLIYSWIVRAESTNNDK